MIAFENIGTPNVDNSTNPTCSHTVPTVADRLALGILIALADTTASAVSFGAQTPSLIRRYNLAFGSSNTMFLFGLAGVNTGAGAWSVTLADACTWGFQSVVYSGIDQTTPWGTYAENQADETSPINLSIASTAAQLIVDFVYSGGSALAAAGGQTERVNEGFGGAMGFRRIGFSEKAGGSPTTAMEWAIADPSEESGLIALPLNAAEGGGGGGPALMGQACY